MDDRAPAAGYVCLHAFFGEELGHCPFAHGSCDFEYSECSCSSGMNVPLRDPFPVVGLQAFHEEDVL